MTGPMKCLKLSSAAGFALGLMLIVSGASARGFAQAAPDNSAQNANHATTADNQSNKAADRHTTAQIRKAIIADSSLSLNGHNCKIIVLNGKVTLKGPVKSDDERQKIAADAATVVSSENISNQLTVQQ